MFECEGFKVDRQEMVRQLEYVWGPEMGQQWRDMVVEGKILQLLNAGCRNGIISKIVQDYLVKAWEKRKAARQEIVLRPVGGGEVS